MSQSSRKRGEYRPPRLTIYGDVAKMTAGGAGSVTEQAAGDKSKNHKA